MLENNKLIVSTLQNTICLISYASFTGYYDIVIRNLYHVNNNLNFNKAIMIMGNTKITIEDSVFINESKSIRCNSIFLAMSSET